MGLVYHDFQSSATDGFLGLETGGSNGGDYVGLVGPGVSRHFEALFRIIGGLYKFGTDTLSLYFKFSGFVFNAFRPLQADCKLGVKRGGIWG
jgi:hypothetical protein